MTILILGGADDEHAVHMRDHLRRRGADALLLDSRWFPTSMAIAFDPVTGSGHLRFPAGRVVDLAEIRAVYWRTYNGVSAPTLPDPEQTYLAGNDARSLFESLLVHLPARWVNGWNAFQLHQTKPAQLARVAALGVPVARTLLSNDPDAVLAFARAVPRTIFKPVQGGAHTRPVTEAHVAPANLRNLALAPVTLQEEIVGTDIRVFVAGDRVFACAIHTDAPDYRDDPGARIESCTLPGDVETWCRELARALELVWTGIDLRRTFEGRHVFLEANPSPMFLAFEERAGLRLTECLAALLMKD